ncbi:inositol (myo)-1(or 4)-monophosphatase 2, isoform CRA_a [Mus musculus]|nr:inositol (myo)-1(or 4)-monophosphatase 2, isoform CRA_a [Mus musculus]
MKPSSEEEGELVQGVGPWDECFEVAVQLALRAGQIIRKALTEEKRVSTKTSAADLVTETDHRVEDLIVSELRKRFPSHRFIAEEATASGAKCVLTHSPTWIIDPIDGTCNFVHRRLLQWPAASGLQGDRSRKGLGSDRNRAQTRPRYSESIPEQHGAAAARQGSWGPSDWQLHLGPLLPGLRCSRRLLSVWPSLLGPGSCHSHH